MRSLIVFFCLICIFQRLPAAVVVGPEDINVDCGAESDTEFGPIVINITLSDDEWKADNYTIYAFKSETDCKFTSQDDYGNSTLSVTGRIAYETFYQWNYSPGIIADDVNNVGDSDKCGWIRTSDERLQVDIAVVQGTLFTTSDKVFTIMCDYKPASANGYDVAEGGVIENPDQISGTGSPNELDLTYNLELISKETGRVLSSTVPIGTEVQLRVRAEGNDDGAKGTIGDENGLQIEKCTASNSDNSDTRVSLIDKYCIDYKDAIDWVDRPDPLDRKGFTSVDLLAYSPAFEMFAITGGSVAHVVIFQCSVTVCRIEDACNGDNCPSKKKKRDTSPKIDALNVFRSKRATDVTGHTQLTMSIVVDDVPSNNQVMETNVGPSDVTTLIVALSVVGALLLTCIIAAIAVACRLTRSRPRKTVDYQGNPAYVS